MRTEERFWSKVDKSSGDCWQWTGGRDAAGYGIFYMSQEKHVLARRYAFEQERGPIPPDKRLLAECENDLCVRPSHMRPATPSEIRLAAIQDGRIPVQRGEEHYNATFTEDDVKEIIRRYKEGGVSYGDLARETGRTRSAIGAILQRRTWKHVQSRTE